MSGPVQNDSKTTPPANPTPVPTQPSGLRGRYVYYYNERNAIETTPPEQYCIGKYQAGDRTYGKTKGQYMKNCISTAEFAQRFSFCGPIGCNPPKD